MDNKVSQPEAKLKPHQRYIWYRRLVKLTLPLYGLGILVLVVMPWPVLRYSLFFAFLILAAILAMMRANSYIFKYDYSFFGPYERTPVPGEAPLLIVRRSRGRIRSFYTVLPVVTWTVYPSGLAIKVMGAGLGFIAKQDIKELIDGRGTVSPRYELMHSSPEVAGPIWFSSKELFNALAELRKSVARAPVPAVGLNQSTIRSKPGKRTRG